MTYAHRLPDMCARCGRPPVEWPHNPCLSGRRHGGTPLPLPPALQPVRTTIRYPGLVGQARPPRTPGRIHALHCLAVVIAVEAGAAVALDSHNPVSWVPPIFAAGFTALWIKAVRSWVRGDT